MTDATDGQCFPVLKNDVILRAARGEKTEYVPVWVMRQAGRYLPEFGEIRRHHDFFDLCQTPELASEVTMQPIRRFNLDAAIIFSDILVIPQALGMEVRMENKVGPVLPEPLVKPEDVKLKLKKDVDVANDLKYVFDAITLTRHKLEGKVPLIGFAGAPWTLMCYMIEGGGSKTMSKAKKWLYQNPYESFALLDLIADVVIEYLVNQVKAGAQMLQLFESNAGYLTPSTFEKYSLPFLRKISSGVKEKLHELAIESVPMIVFAKDAHYGLAELGSDTNYFDVVGLDWTIKPGFARSSVHQDITLQGNLDPCALYGTVDDIDELVAGMVEEFGSKNYIANLGHGIYPDTKPESVATFVNAVHKHSKSHK